MPESQLQDGKHLRSQLENYKLIVDVNKELLDKNISTRDELAIKLTTAQAFVDQLEQSGGNLNYNATLNIANQVIDEIDKIIRAILTEDTP